MVKFDDTRRLFCAKIQPLKEKKTKNICICNNFCCLRLGAQPPIEDYFVTRLGIYGPITDTEADEMDAKVVAKFPLHRNVVKLFCTLPHGHDVTIDCFYLYLCTSKFEI